MSHPADTLKTPHEPIHDTKEAHERDTQEKEVISEKDLESSDGDSVDPGFERRTLRHVDWRLLPLLGLIYALALIDRTNLGVASIAGMTKALKLNIGERYSIASVAYFPPYIILELPSNLILRAVGPRYWLAFLTVGWGAVQLGMGYVKDWHMLVVCRVFLGVMEAGFFPAIVFIITTWYTRYEVQRRLAGFYLFAILISGFSSIMAYGFSLLDGKQGLAGWSWIFIIEGAITMLLGVLAFVFVVDFPERNKFLSTKQTKLILKRIEDDRGDSVPDPLTTQSVIAHLLDWKVWVWGLMFMTQTMPAYFVGFFMPIILRAQGWGLRDSFLLGAPPYGFAFVFAFAFAWISDKTHKRVQWMVIQVMFTLIGLFVTAYAKQAGVRYFGLFFVNAGASGCVPGVLAYSANNITSQSKRAVSTAITIAFGGIGGIFATTVFRNKDSPRYIPGLWATIACQFFMLILMAGMTFYFKRQNKLLREGKRGPIEGMTGFYYTL